MADSFSLRSTNRAVAAMLAIEAWHEQPDALAQAAMFSSLTAGQEFVGYRLLPLNAIPVALGAVPGSDTVLLAQGNRVEIVHPESGTLSGPFSRADLDRAAPTSLRVSADGARAAVMLGGLRASAAATASVGIVDIARRRYLASPWKVPRDVTDLGISADGRVVHTVRPSASGSWGVATWDVQTGRMLGSADIGATTVAVGPGDRLFLGDTSTACARRRRAPCESGVPGPGRLASWTTGFWWWATSWSPPAAAASWSWT